MSGKIHLSGSISKDIGFKENPVKEYVNAGFYVLNPMALSYIPKDKVFDMPSLFEVLRAEEKRIIAFPIYEDWIDVGRPNDLETANEVKNIFEIDLNLIKPKL